jgi:arabinofuranan 3-O-arabinosyltransferase
VRTPRLTVNGRVGVMFAVLAYLPMLFTQPGQVSADTKTYLTLDPGRLMSRAWSMWDPMVGAGTVTHQNIGFLFPLGPVYWGADWVGLPGWVTQRLIWGTILWAAAYGTWKLCRWMGWSILPAVIAAIAYGWSPYLLSYLARLSVILMPWAALPWLILFAAMAVRESRWRAPAMFALVIALVGSVNATSLLLVGIGPVLWVLAEWGNGRHRSTAVLAGGTRTLVLTLGVSVWWVLGLRIQGAYGLPILDYTETYQVVAASSTPQEILRGLGYWFFYGGDRARAVGGSLGCVSLPLDDCRRDDPRCGLFAGAVQCVCGSHSCPVVVGGGSRPRGGGPLRSGRPHPTGRSLGVLLHPRSVWPCAQRRGPHHWSFWRWLSASVLRCSGSVCGHWI